MSEAGRRLATETESRFDAERVRLGWLIERYDRSVAAGADVGHIQFLADTIHRELHRLREMRMSSGG